MIYKILLDGTNIYGTSEDMELISPKLSIELNSAGTLTFTVPPFHRAYDSIHILTSDVEVYEFDELIWFGRVLDVSMNFNKDKEVTCEGAMAFFNDSVQRPYEYEDVLVSQFFTDVINNHNEYTPANRHFKVGNITVSDVNIYRKLNYDKTIDVINTMCLDTEGGYIFFRKEDDGVYIDWLDDMPYHSSQDIQFGINLTDLTQTMSGSQLFTSILPLGAEVDGVTTTIASVTQGGVDYIDSEAAEIYGRILTVVKFDGIAVPQQLYDTAVAWLEKQDLTSYTIECSAADLSYNDESYKPFRVGQKVHVISNPHLIDTTLPLNKLEISLDSAVKSITVGTPEKKELTEIYNS